MMRPDAIERPKPKRRTQLGVEDKKKKVHLINVQPLRTDEEIEDFRWALKYTGKERDLMMFNFGVNTGLRISDIIKLKVKDVKGVTQLLIIEQKTSKPKSLRLPKSLRQSIIDYTRRMNDNDYLFPSQKGGHITKTQAYRILQKASDVLERNDIGTHTMRKTFGYRYYKKFKDVASLQKLFNHSHPSVTLRYIGIEQEELDDSMEDFDV